MKNIDFLCLLIISQLFRYSSPLTYKPKTEQKIKLKSSQYLSDRSIDTMISWQDFGKKKKVDQNLSVQVIILQKQVTVGLFIYRKINTGK